jgi:hypothetical protein
VAQRVRGNCHAFETRAAGLPRTRWLAPNRTAGAMHPTGD